MRAVVDLPLSNKTNLVLIKSYRSVPSIFTRPQADTIFLFKSAISAPDLIPSS